VFRYLVRRILWACLLFLAVTLVTYIIFFVIPVDPARLFAGKNASPAGIEKVKHELGLDRPVYIQYLKFLNRLIIHQSLGYSYATDQNVNDVIAKAAPVTASLVFGGMIIWMTIGLTLGILSALRPRSLLDRTGMVFVLIGISAHPVWLGLMAIYFISFKLGWTPISGYCNLIHPQHANGCDTPLDWAYHLILPWCTYAILFAANYVRMIRANVMETLGEDYVRTARAKGAPEQLVMRSHVLRNALLPIVTMLGMDIGLALGGAIFTENVYGIQGLGFRAIDAITQFDLPTVLGVTVFATLAIIFFNLLVDLVYAWIDPRIRLA
jgi:peptide/nickel transport system permease protein